jgi:LmbE family N-acetylglucosaminyl deacetylase
MLTFTLDPSRVEGLNVLAIGAHADDIEIGCGGTILRLISDGLVASARWVVLSAPGDRASEAQAGSDAFLEGVDDRQTAIEGFRDGFLPYSGGAVKDYFETLKDGPSPDLVFAPRRDDLHQDHRLVGELTWNTFRDHAILEYEIPKYEGDLATPNVYVRIPDWAAERKVELLLSTFRTQSGRDWFTRDLFLAQMRLRAIECRAPSGYAEGLVGRKVVL